MKIIKSRHFKPRWQFTKEHAWFGVFGFTIIFKDFWELEPTETKSEGQE